VGLQFNRTFASRFAAKVGPSLPNGCTEWQGARLPRGYGQVATAGVGTQELAHRAIFAFERGPIPTGAVVMHECDNPRCVNSAHLRLGTHADNTQDMVAKRRHSWRNGQPWQKLSARDARTVRRLRAMEMPQQRIANLMGVSRPLISLLLAGHLAYANNRTEKSL
jgi:hypothetical protein